MDFNQILESIAPGLNLTVVGAAIAAIVTFVVKVRSLFKDIRLNSDISEVFKKALPKDLSVSVAKLAKSEIDRLIVEIKAEFTNAIRENTLLTKDVARGILSLRSIPDDLKHDIASHFGDTKLPAIETIKLELSKDIVEASVEQIEPEQPTNKIYID